MKARVALSALGLMSAMPAYALVNGNGVIFAAASLKGPLDDAVALLVRQARCVAPDKTIRVSYASSGILARQIRFGAPADLFITADATWLGDLQKRGMTERSPESRRILLTNRLVMIGGRRPAGVGVLSADGGVSRQLGHRRLAIGDPGHVPAGRYARAALTSLGLWKQAKRKLVMAPNVRAALAYVARGEVPFGIVYRTDALADPAVHILATVPATSHPPIAYVGAIVSAGETRCARRWLEALRSPPARAIFRKAGYGVPAAKK